MKDWRPIHAQVKTPQECMTEYKLQLRFGTAEDAAIYARIYKKMTSRDITEEMRPDGKVDDRPA